MERQTTQGKNTPRHFQILGTGCAKCRKLAENVEIAVSRLDLEATVEKISDITKILSFGVLGTPALVIDGKVVAAGSLLTVEEIIAYLQGSVSDAAADKPQQVSQTTSKGSCCCENQNHKTEEKPCCGPVVTEKDWSMEPDNAPWITDMLDTSVGDVPIINTSLSWSDKIGSWKARWGIGRMRFWVKPILYAIGNPTPESPVMVSANYKMSFDQLRASLAGIDSWILVLDTKGVNVWCAAGKGTFGTDELIRQITTSGLSGIVTHSKVIVPQLGAPGIAAHEVQKKTGFRVIYGPVRAEDIPTFLKNDMKAAPEMRRVEFKLRDRIAVIPVELVMSARNIFLILIGLILLAGLGTDGYVFSRLLSRGLPSAALFLGAFCAGTILGPILLPWLPGRAFSLKGAWLGLLMSLSLVAYVAMVSLVIMSWFAIAAWMILLPVITSFALMNFTGSTTYTSLSGVRREMRFAVPIQAIFGVVGITLWLVARFV